MSCYIDGWTLLIDAQLGLASKGYSIASASQNRTFIMQAVDKKGYEGEVQSLDSWDPRMETFISINRKKKWGGFSSWEENRTVRWCLFFLLNSK